MNHENNVSCSSTTLTLREPKLFTKQCNTKWFIKMDFFAVYQVDVLDWQDVILCFDTSVSFTWTVNWLELKEENVTCR